MLELIINDPNSSGTFNAASAKSAADTMNDCIKRGNLPVIVTTSPPISYLMYLAKPARLLIASRTGQIYSYRGDAAASGIVIESEISNDTIVYALEKILGDSLDVGALNARLTEELSHGDNVPTLGISSQDGKLKAMGEWIKQ